MSRPKKNGPGARKEVGGRSQGAADKGSSAPDKRKRGFQVGPAHAAHNAYLGKAKKIKADLIMKSKLKKQYAKVLKEEGVQSERLSKGKGKDQGTGDGDDGQKAGDAEEANTGHIGTPSKRPERPLKSRKGGREGKDKDVKAEKKVRALSPTDIGPPMPQSSYRQLKKEAFAKYHPPVSGGRGRGQPNMGARMGALLEKIKRDR